MLNENNELVYSVKISDDNGNESTGVYRHPKYLNELVDNFYPNPLNSVWEIFVESTNSFKNCACIGKRKLVNNKLGEYTWKTFGEVHDSVVSFGSGLLNLNACPLIKTDDDVIKSARFLGIYIANCEEWTIADFACNAYNIISVALYDSLGPESSGFILGQTKMQSIVCNKHCLLKLFDTLEGCDVIHLKHIILVDSETDSTTSATTNSKEMNDTENKEISTNAIIEEKCKKFGLNILKWKDVIAEGNKKKAEIPHPNLNAVCTICYTSGTTGLPKGVIMTNRNFLSAISGITMGPLKMPNLDLSSKDVHISYLPLAHIYERIFIPLCFAFGVRVGFYAGNVQTLVEDIQTLKPTIFISVPRLYNRIHEKIYMSINKKSHFVQSLFHKGVNQKIKKMNNTGEVTHFFWDKLLFNKTKQILGGNVKGMLNGSAPISSDVLKKLKSIFCVPLLEAYGMTETLGTGLCSYIYDKEVGHIGGPLPNVEFKIVSVPEMNYFSNDTCPKGELYLRGPSICTRGYFKLKKETSEMITEDGWIRTGDIVMLNPNGSVRLIDRKKNIFKLSQGEYIAADKIESIYQQSLYISQIFVFGYSFESFLVCIIFPTEESVNIWRNKNKIEKTYEETLKLPEFKNEVLKDLIKIGKSSGLKGYEQIKDIYFTNEAFSTENDLLTPTGKIKRHAVFKQFKEQIDEMYDIVKRSTTFS